MTRLLRLVGAAGLVLAGVTLAPSPAHAAGCPSAQGVTVVVDFAGSGASGLDSGCVSGGGGDSAAQLFAAAGHALTRVQSQPGAVCKVDGVREADACAQMPPANAFWGLFWADGEGDWVFSQQGVDALDVPDGGSVGFAWQDGGSYDPPGMAPPRHAEPEPSDPPTQDPEPTEPPSTPPPTGGGGGGTTPPGPATSSAPASPDQSASSSPAARGRSEDRSARPREDEDRQGRRDRERDRERSAETEPSDDPAAAGTDTQAEPTADAPAPDDEALPVWAGPAAVGGLAGVVGIAAYLRRRAGAA